MSKALNAMLESPLHAFDLPARVATPTDQNRVVLSELGNMGYLVLRGKADDVAFMQAVAGVLGQALLGDARVALAQLQHAQQHGRCGRLGTVLQLVAQGLLDAAQQRHQGFQGGGLRGRGVGVHG